METSIYSLLNEFREAKQSNREMGDQFERLVANFLVADPQYVDLYSGVWLWSEWPGRNNQPDTGIDLVALERHTGEYCAIQCKFYDPNSQLQKADIDSFFTASGKAPFTRRMIVSTTDKWSKHAEEALKGQSIPVSRLRVQDLANSPIDWSQFSLKNPKEIKLKAKKILRPHQKVALDKVMDGFADSNRGKLIMACGTGKTFTSLKIAERFAKDNKGAYVLFLVPSISLLSQTLREWTAESELSIHSFAVCSDSKVGKKSEDISAHDLAFPATTDTKKLALHMKGFAGKSDLTVVFSTYQSIEVVADAQKQGVPTFDLIICDEAHRTTGVTLAGDDESHFVRVHSQDFIKGKKRLYMTATPRIFSDSSKSQADENDADLCSMDDMGLYGREFHRLGFSEAVSSDLLSDYKVMVLAVDEKYVSTTFQSQIANSDNEINLNDAVKITGCWNGLSKRMASNADGQEFESDTHPMRRAVAFSASIKDSKRIADLFEQVVDEYRQKNEDDELLLDCEVHHVDGTMNALIRNQHIDWLKEDTIDQGNVCRILSNVRCLSEGVDVPALDAVMFLNPRNSVVDVVQSVGRVMRKAEGKQYGYIILPIGIPTDQDPKEALNNNNKYKVVWQVLQALRAHDDRFNATVNKLDLNNERPDNIQIIGVGGGSGDGEDFGHDGDGQPSSEQNGDGTPGTPSPVQINMFPYIEEWRDAIYARIVIKCGDRRYWDSWAKDVADIAEGHIARINLLLEGANPAHKTAFEEFLQGLQSNINPGISQDDAVEMLAQHLITRPVFDALFDKYAFTQNNPVSLAMQKMLDLMEDQALEKETESLDKFYASVQERASGIDNAEGKQKIILELYDKFFKTAFPRMAERLGIVYTPVQVVDFIINSVEDALQQEFGTSISDSGVHLLDPFTGTGTFIVRLLQSGLIRPEDLAYKFQNEIHANEIVLLAYYIAAINIEETYHELAEGDYQPFEGIVLTDTFQMYEEERAFSGVAFPVNNERVLRQSQSDIRVIIGNPPYSSGQNSANDNNQNLTYSELDKRISSTYIKKSSKSVGKSKAYDSYIRAIRWGSDRLRNRGIVCYVTNGAFIDNNAMDGLRKSLIDEFTSIYCFNLRGNQRTSGETSRKEGGKIFDSGSRATIAITLLIKNPEKKGDYKLHYHDIGDYLKREEKLNLINQYGSMKGIGWDIITPNESHDWINQRDPVFDTFIPVGDKQNKQLETLFEIYSMGVKTNRDYWVYNFSQKHLANNLQRMIAFYNQQVEEYASLVPEKRPPAKKFIATNQTQIKWTEDLIRDFANSVTHSYEKNSERKSMYRPFCKQWLYYNKAFNWTHHLMPRFFPDEHHKNIVICVTGVGVSKEFSAIISDTLPDLCIQGAATAGQCLPLYIYEKPKPIGGLFKETQLDEEYVRKDTIPNTILTEFCSIYDSTITKEDIFYYVYGLLHSPEYKRRFAADLKKMLPRIPFTEDFWAFSRAGRELAHWHLNYETIEPYPVTEFTPQMIIDPEEQYRVKKMYFGKNGKETDKTTIIYNSHLSLLDIPLEAYEYKVCDKSALEWIIERYKFKRDKASQNENDPNDWSDDPRYIVDLVKRIVRVSLETVKIVEALPALNERVQE